MRAEGATHDKIYIVSYIYIVLCTIFAEKVSLKYTFHWKYFPFTCLPNKNESLKQEVFKSFRATFQINENDIAILFKYLNAERCFYPFISFNSEFRGLWYTLIKASKRFPYRAAFLHKLL